MASPQNYCGSSPWRRVGASDAWHVGSVSAGAVGPRPPRGPQPAFGTHKTSESGRSFTTIIGLYTFAHNAHSPRTGRRRRRSASPPRPSGPAVRSFSLSHDSNRRTQRTRAMADGDQRACGAGRQTTVSRDRRARRAATARPSLRRSCSCSSRSNRRLEFVQ